MVMTGHFLLQRPIARRPGLAACSAARGVSTGVTSRGTPGRARQVGQPVGPEVQGCVQVSVRL